MAPFRAYANDHNTYTLIDPRDGKAIIVDAARLAKIKARFRVDFHPGPAPERPAPVPSRELLDRRESVRDRPASLTPLESLRRQINACCGAADAIGRKCQGKGDDEGAATFDRLARDLARLSNDVMRYEMRGESADVVAKRLLKAMAHAG